MSSLVSIIIPVYNSEDYLERTIQSAIDQTWENKEIIIIDDGSDDRSLAIAKKYESAFVKVITQKNNGAASARNKGLSIATGDYIQFLDSDDILSSNKIEVQINALNDSPGMLAVCSTVHFYDGTNHMVQVPSTYEDSFLFSSNDPVEFLINLWGGNGLGASMIQTNSWLIPIDIIKKNDPWMEFYSPDDDGEYFCRLLLSSKGIIYTKNCYNYYRRYKSSRSLSNRASLKALEGCYMAIILKKENLLLKTSSEKAKLAIIKQLMDLAIFAYPKHEALTNLIEGEIKNLGNFNYRPALGGVIIDKISYFLGWKFARRLSILKNNLFK